MTASTRGSMPGSTTTSAIARTPCKLRVIHPPADNRHLGWPALPQRAPSPRRSIIGPAARAVIVLHTAGKPSGRRSLQHPLPTAGVPELALPAISPATRPVLHRAERPQHRQRGLRHHVRSEGHPGVVDPQRSSGARRPAAAGSDHGVTHMPELGPFTTDPSGLPAVSARRDPPEAPVKAVGGPIDSHDIQHLPNGDFLVLTYKPRDHVDLSSFGGPADATVVDAEIQEITRRGGSSSGVGTARTTSRSPRRDGGGR